jgi:hypothetical protein
LPSAGFIAQAAARPDVSRSRARASADLRVPTLERIALLGEFDLTLRCSPAQRFADASLAAALAGSRVPVLRAEARTRRATGATLRAAMRGAR